MKEKYLELMEKTLSAYSDEHVLRYFNDVKTYGLTEHGFPRLTANIGILIAHGRRTDLLPIFIEMMDFCCKTIPCVKAANDFSVREIVGCLCEVENASAVPKDKTDFWRSCLAGIVPETCYNVFATSVTDTVRNWALFTAVSEYFRLTAGIGGNMDFIELQLSQQLQWLDENGMYMDNPKHPQRQPIQYDFVPRGLFCLLLNRGYRGKSYHAIDEALKKAGLLTLDMQSPNGEMAFGGRSNQFLHNEAWVAIVLEYETKRYAKEGNLELAAKFKSATARAIAVTEEWLNKEPIRHIKNRFPTETKYGCESYAYFDKYMITAASFLWAAYLICDDSIEFEAIPDETPCVAQTSPYFNKLFVKAGGYDLTADPHYDSNGLGRIHRLGAPLAICLSCPCPAHPDFTVDVEPHFAFSLSSAIRTGDKWMFGADEDVKYEVTDHKTDTDSASATLLCSFADGKCAKEQYTVSKNGVSVTVEGNGEIAYSLPAFSFDGETATDITVKENLLAVSYEGWICRYTANGTILDLNMTAANRNGHYRAFLATAKDTLSVKIEIEKA